MYIDRCSGNPCSGLQDNNQLGLWCTENLFRVSVTHVKHEHTSYGEVSIYAWKHRWVWYATHPIQTGWSRRSKLLFY